MLELGDACGPRGRLPAHRHGPAARPARSATRSRSARRSRHLRGEGPADFTGARARCGARICWRCPTSASTAGKAEHVRWQRSRTVRRSRRTSAGSAAQGGDPAEAALPSAPVVTRCRASADGFVRSIGAVDIGMAALRLGAGRQTKDDTIDHAVGDPLPEEARRRGRCRRRARRGARTRRRIGEARREAEVLAAYELGGDAATAEVDRPRDNRLMPELPEVETIRLKLEPHLVGRTFGASRDQRPAARASVRADRGGGRARGRSECRRSSAEGSI